MIHNDDSCMISHDIINYLWFTVFNVAQWYIEFIELILSVISENTILYTVIIQNISHQNSKKYFIIFPL
jgi:hypothetical protein